MGNYLPPIGHAGWLPDPHITKYVDVCERSAEICQNAAQYIESSIEGATNTVTRLEQRAEEATAEINLAVSEARALVPQIEEDIETVRGYVADARAIKADIDATHDEIDTAAGVIAEAVTNAQGYATVASTAANASAQSAIDATTSADAAGASANTATGAAAEASTSATNAATSAATAQTLVAGIPSDVADAIEQADIPGKVQNYLEDEHIAADFEFDTFADYEAAWTAGTVKAGDNIYIKSDERFITEANVSSDINNGSMNRVKPDGTLASFGSVQSVNNEVVEEAINTIETKKQVVVDLVNALPSTAQGVVETYLEENHVSADREFDTYAAYEAAWSAGSGLAEGDNVYIKNDERFVSDGKPFLVDLYSTPRSSMSYKYVYDYVLPVHEGYTPVGVIDIYSNGSDYTALVSRYNVKLIDGAYKLSVVYVDNFSPDVSVFTGSFVFKILYVADKFLGGNL